MRDDSRRLYRILLWSALVLFMVEALLEMAAIAREGGTGARTFMLLVHILGVVGSAGGLVWIYRDPESRG